MIFLTLLTLLVLSPIIQSTVLYDQGSTTIAPSSGNIVDSTTITNELHITFDIKFNAVSNDETKRSVLEISSYGYWPMIYTLNGLLHIGFTNSHNSSDMVATPSVDINKIYHIDLRITQNSMLFSLNGFAVYADSTYGTHDVGQIANIYVTSPNLVAADFIMTNLMVRSEIEQTVQMEIRATLDGTTVFCRDPTWTPTSCVIHGVGSLYLKSSSWKIVEDSNGYPRIGCSCPFTYCGSHYVEIVCIKIAGTNSHRIYGTGEETPGLPSIPSYSIINSPEQSHYSLWNQLLQPKVAIISVLLLQIQLVFVYLFGCFRDTKSEIYILGSDEERNLMTKQSK